MNDDDLTGDLEGWAAATDPAADPITADEVLARPATEGRGRAPSRWLAVAAAVLVVAGLAGVVAVVAGDDDGGEVVTDAPAVEDGPRTQVIVEGSPLDPEWQGAVHRFSLFGPDGQGLTGPLLSGASLIVDQHLAPGRWEATFLTYLCAGTSAGCGPPNVDGTPEVDGETPMRCDVAIDVPADGGRIVIGLADVYAGTGTCTVRGDDRLPELTVPPAWSVRPGLEWSCGNDTFDADQAIVDDPPGKGEGFACFEAAAEAGDPVEIPVVELRRQQELVRSWWRVLPEPVDGARFEILRELAVEGPGAWVRVLCHGVTTEEGYADVTTPEGGLVGYRYTTARPTDCTDEEPLSFALPPLDGPAPAPTTTPEPTTTTTTAPPAAGTIDVVLAAELPTFIEGGTRRWSVLVDGEEVAAGPLTESGVLLDGTGRSEVQQVADDLAVPEGAAVAVRVDDFDCYADQAVECRPDAMGPNPGATADGGCTAEAPVERGDAVLVATFGETCDGAWTADPPPLTVPAAFSLRPASDECGALGDDERWGECLAEAYTAGRVAERSRREGVVRTTTLVREGAVTVFRRIAEPGEAVAWTVQTCATVEVDAEGRVLTPRTCEQEETLTP